MFSLTDTPAAVSRRCNGSPRCQLAVRESRANGLLLEELRGGTAGCSFNYSSCREQAGLGDEPVLTVTHPSLPAFIKHEICDANQLGAEQAPPDSVHFPADFIM